MLEIGKSLLRENKEDSVATDGARARNAVKWVQKAFAMTEQMNDPEAPGTAELKVCCHPRDRYSITSNITVFSLVAINS